MSDPGDNIKTPAQMPPPLPGGELVEVTDDLPPREAVSRPTIERPETSLGDVFGRETRGRRKERPELPPVTNDPVNDEVEVSTHDIVEVELESEASPTPVAQPAPRPQQSEQAPRLTPIRANEPSFSGARRAGGNRKFLIGAVAGVVILLLLVVIVVLSGDDGEEAAGENEGGSEARTDETDEDTPRNVRTRIPPPAPFRTAVALGTGGAVYPTPGVVAYTMIAIPTEADVLWGDDVLCTETPCRVELDEALDSVELTVRLEGYIDALTTLSPVSETGKQPVRIVLEPVPPPPKKKK